MIEQFIDAMLASGLEPASTCDIIPCAESRLIKDKYGKKRIYYSYSEESDRAWGHWYDCRTGQGDNWWSKSSRKWTKDEREEWEQQKKAIREAVEREKADRQEKVAQEATTRYKRLKTATTHPYLERKGLEPVKPMRIDGDLLVIPAIDGDNIIWSLQDIEPDGGKMFMTGGKTAGTFCPLGINKSDNPEFIYIAEGVATALAVHKSTGCPAIIAWSAGNLLAAGREVHKLWPKAQLIFAADNDEKQPGEITRETNPGVWYAQQAAVKLGMGWVRSPDEAGQDWADVLKSKGIDFVRTSLLVMPSLVTSTPEVETYPFPLSVESPSGDQLPEYESHDISYYMSEFDDAPVKAPERADGNPKWFDQFIWTKQPNKRISNLYEIADLHDGRSLSNRVVFIKNKWPGLFVQNEFSDEVIVRMPPPWLTEKEVSEFKVHRVSDVDIFEMICVLEHYGFKPDKEKTASAIDMVAVQERVHPVRNYFNLLKWDGLPRLATWLKTYAGAEAKSDEYLSKVGTMWMVAGVARIYRPGTKFDHMLVLEGEGGIGKSTLLKELSTFGREEPVAYFSESFSMGDILKPQSPTMLQGKLIVEIPELDGMDKVTDETLKAWITKTDDEFIKKWSNNRTTYPRQFILAGTTNKSAWLRDPTGNRRYWPVYCTRIDMEGIKRDREQLWAEAAHLYNNGYKIYIPNDDPIYVVARQEQAERMMQDPWQEVLEPYLEKAARPLTYNELCDCIGIKQEYRNAVTDARIRGVMHTLRYEYKVCYSQSGHNKKVWVKK